MRVFDFIYTNSSVLVSRERCFGIDALLHNVNEKAGYLVDPTAIQTWAETADLGDVLEQPRTLFIFRVSDNETELT